MGKGKGIALLIGGILAFEYAAHKTGQPGLGQLVSDMVHSAGIGEGVDTVFRFFFDYYARDFFYDKFSALGTAGQASMYSGIGNLLYHAIKKGGKTLESKVEDIKE
ncbi:hypothetical protein FJZ53_05700 [Candidatus Woesearchaeota archaeon]|nr:hypothetical protein [Candidatus Woesearchaeota archaeon]